MSGNAKYGKGKINYEFECCICTKKFTSYKGLCIHLGRELIAIVYDDSLSNDDKIDLIKKIIECKKKEGVINKMLFQSNPSTY